MPSLQEEISVTIERIITTPKQTENIKKCSVEFGITPDKKILLFKEFKILLKPPQVIAVTGASGSGKSSLLKYFKENLNTTSFDDMINPDQTLIDSFPHLNYGETLQRLAIFGLSDVRIWLRRFNELSDGQKYRTRLAYLYDSKGILIVDEFCASLDRETAKTVSVNLKKNIKPDQIWIIATTHEDIIPFLAPDLWVHKKDVHSVEVKQFKPETDKYDYIFVVPIAPKYAWDFIKTRHYKGKRPVMHECFGLFQKDELIGAAIFSGGHKNNSNRYKVLSIHTNKYDLHDLAKKLRHLNRLVIDERFRGRGLGKYFLQKCIDKLPVGIIEVIPKMGESNKLFEKIGFRQFGWTKTGIPYYLYFKEGYI